MSVADIGYLARVRPAIRRLLHVNLSIHDVPAAAAFYRDVLGLDPGPRPAEGGRPGAWFRVGDVEVHLALDDNADGHASRRHVAFEVDDLDAMRRHLEAHGHAIEAGSPAPGVRRIFVRDPSGNRLEIVAATAPRSG